MFPRLKGLVRGSRPYAAWLARRQEREVALWRARGARPPLPHRLKQEVLAEIARRHGLELLVETGTYHGDMVAALAGRFRRVWSIELGLELYRAARARFRGLAHVRILHGDSARVLPEVLAEVDRPALFWLDGHWSAGSTAKGERDTPVVAELDLILAHPVARHAILVDDARHFTGQGDYPRLDEVRARVERARPGTRFELADDILRALPPVTSA